MTTSGAPNSAIPTPNQSASRPRPTSPKARIDPSIPPAPTAAVRMPTPGSPVSRSSIATTTMKTVRQPRVKVCTKPSDVISASPRSAAMVANPCEDLVTAAPRGLRARRRVVGEADHDQAAQQRRGRAGREYGRRPAHGEQDRRGGGAAERGERVEQAADGVRARQLPGGGAQRREQRRVRRPEQRLRDRGDDREAVDRGDRAAGGGHRRDAAQRRGADQADARQDPFAAHPVGHRREPRRQERRRGHAGGRDDPDRSHAAGAERHDAEGDHERALARPDRAERDLRAADRPAPGHCATIPERRNRAQERGFGVPSPGIEPGTVGLSSGPPRRLVWLCRAKYSRWSGSEVGSLLPSRGPRSGPRCSGGIVARRGCAVRWTDQDLPLADLATAVAARSLPRRGRRRRSRRPCRSRRVPRRPLRRAAARRVGRCPGRCRACG